MICDLKFSLSGSPRGLLIAILMIKELDRHLVYASLYQIIIEFNLYVLWIRETQLAE